jgi:hypothetical protein
MVAGRRLVEAVAGSLSQHDPRKRQRPWTLVVRQQLQLPHTCKPRLDIGSGHAHVLLKWILPAQPAITLP